MNCWIRLQAEEKAEAKEKAKKNHIIIFWHMFCLTRLGKNQVNVYENISQSIAHGLHSMHFTLLLSSAISHGDGAPGFLLTQFAIRGMLEPECFVAIC